MTLKASGVYSILHTGSGKRYVGSSVNLDARLKKHLRLLRKGEHHSYKLQRDWNKYSEGAFEIEVLLRCSVEELLSKEQLAIDRLNAVAAGYNVALFAGSPARGAKFSEETRRKMSEATKTRKPISEETRERMREASIKREAKKKVEGFVVSPETKMKLIAKLKGRPVSAETRAKMSANHKGQTLTSEQQRKQIAALTGRKLSVAHRAAIAAAGRRRWAKVKETAL